MKSKKVRIAIPLLILLCAGIAFGAFVDVGTLSAFGWGDIALLCPLGALSTMIAGKLLIPRAVVSLAVFVVFVLLVGRAFCAWLCPVPVVSLLRDLFSGKPSVRTERSCEDCGAKAHAADLHEGVERVSGAEAKAPLALTEREKRLLKKPCSKACAEKRGLIDGRHIVLGGALASAAVFGFPVFCLICPIGLSFATIFLLIRAFGFGDVSWALVAVPLVLVFEVVVFRRWCHLICPISALMSLVAKGNRTVLPVVDEASCIEAPESGHHCGRCASVCPEGIDPRHPERGNGMNECTRCMACVEACPSGALRMSMLPKKRDGESAQQEAKRAGDGCE